MDDDHATAGLVRIKITLFTTVETPIVAICHMVYSMIIASIIDTSVQHTLVGSKGKLNVYLVEQELTWGGKD